MDEKLYLKKLALREIKPTAIRLFDSENNDAAQRSFFPYWIWKTI